MSSPAHGNYSGRRLVIVGCGYVGAAVAELAISKGMQVTAITRNAGTAAALRAGGIDSVVTDVAGHDWYDAIPAAPDFLLNCLSGGGTGLDGYRHSYLRGMESVLRWAETKGAVGTIVYTSSTSVYQQDGGAVVDETATTTESLHERPGILVATENRLMHARSACNRWFILRLAGIYGPGRHHLLDQVRGGEIAGQGSHHLNLIHRDDIVAAIWACFTAPVEVKNEIFNVNDDEPVRKRDIVEWLAKELGTSSPEFTGETIAGRRAVPPDRIISNRKICRTLGWAPRFPSFRDGYSAILQQK